MWLASRSLICLVIIVLFTQPLPATAKGIPPFGTSLELNLKVYNRMVKNKNVRLQELEALTSELLVLANNQGKPVAEAYIRFQYASILKEKGRKTEALSYLKKAIDILAGLESDKHENGIRPRSLYKQAFKSMLEVAKSAATIDIDQWVTEHLASSNYLNSSYHRDGIRMLKMFYANYLFEKKEFAQAKVIYEELLIAFPRDKNFSLINDRLKVIARDLETDRYLQFLKRRRISLFTIPLVIVALGLLIYLVNKKWPEIYIFKDRTGIIRENLVDIEETDIDPEQNGILPFLNYNNPLAYLILRVWKPSFKKMFLMAFCLMFLLHFAVALFDNNLYFEQNGVMEGISDIASGRFEKWWRSFSTIPRGHEPWQKEYFSNDYYGLIVNSLINPVIFVTIFGIYSQFEKIWLKLLSQGTIRPRNQKAKKELYQYLFRMLNKRWHFWVSIIIPLSATFSLWYGVSNQPDRASYLDFGEGVMPIYHGLYLFLIWHLLVMMIVKILTSIIVLRKIFSVYAEEGKVNIHLEPLHPDRCCGMSAVGRYALLLHLLVFFEGISVSSRVFFDFALVGTSLQKQPLLLAGIVTIVIVGFFVFFAPLYIVRGRMMSVKNGMLAELNQEHAVQQEKFLKMLHDENMDRRQLEFMQELAKIHAQIKRIPPWPFDLRTLSAFVGTVLLPIILPLVIQIELKLFL
jgi:hypothetical protein